MKRSDQMGYMDQNKRIKLSRKMRSESTHDFLQHYRTAKSEQLVTKNDTLTLQFCDLGRSKDNPIVLSDEDSIQSLDSSVCTEQSGGSEPLSAKDYDLFSEHNYVLNFNVIIEAKQAIIDLNRELKEKQNFSKQTELKPIDGLSIERDMKSQEMEISSENLRRNHSKIDETGFARHLNLIKSRDLKRKPYAYLSSRFAINGISRSIYAGVDTKKAVLDFSKCDISQKYLPKTESNGKSIKRMNIRPKTNEKNRHVSNNWLSYLENFDFSSPLSQKIIRIFPEFQSKKNPKNIWIFSNHSLTNLCIVNVFIKFSTLIASIFKSNISFLFIERIQEKK